MEKENGKKQEDTLKLKYYAQLHVLLYLYDVLQTFGLSCFGP